MTKQHRATPYQWEYMRERTEAGLEMTSCILELLARVQAIELALRAQAGLLTEGEQADIGVVPVSALRGAVRHAVDLAIGEARKRLGDSSSTSKPTASIVNINDDVSVRLTDYGRSIIPHVELMYMKTDTDGWTRIQMHHFMRIFGPRSWSQENIFERNEIKIHS